jgi:hypothetical protein
LVFGGFEGTAPLALCESFLGHFPGAAVYNGWHRHGYAVWMILLAFL